MVSKWRMYPVRIRMLKPTYLSGFSTTVLNERAYKGHAAR